MGSHWRYVFREVLGSDPGQASPILFKDFFFLSLQKKKCWKAL
jgi:hypothetical protein